MDDMDGYESDAMSNASFAAFSGSGVSSRTSNSASMRSASPVPSVFSMTDSFREQAFRQEFGRHLNNYSEVYRLPADEEELSRLDLQHALFRRVMGKYPPPMQHVMADNVPGETKACLDLGCGSGSWIMDVARDFPHCSAVAVDLVPMQTTDMPPNLRSEVDDINLGLEHFYGDFNVVHARLVSSGIRNYQALVNHIAHVLRPGGLVELMEFDFQVYDVNKRRFEVNLNLNEILPPWFGRWMNFIKAAARQRGGDVEAAYHLERWVRSNPAYENVVYREFFLQVSPWASGNDPDTRQQNLYAQVFREDIKAFLKSGRPLLLGSGLPVEVVDTLQENARIELEQARLPGYIRVQTVYAMKRHDFDGPPPAPSHP